MYYLDVMADLHRRLSPRAYLEIGVGNGRCLALASCPTVGIDPAYGITAQLAGEVFLFRTTSDKYFGRPDPLAPTGGVPFDLAFIDGLHLFEFALRDLIFAERHSSARGVIVFDDMLPRTVDEAARVRHTTAWTGDVFGMLEVLRRYRQDLVVVPLDAYPTGSVVVFNIDPSSRVLEERYDDIVGQFRRPDPQTVPQDVLDRFTVIPPNRLLDSGVLEFLAGSEPTADARPDAAALQSLVIRRLGRGFLADQGN